MLFASFAAKFGLVSFGCGSVALCSPRLIRGGLGRASFVNSHAADEFV